MNRRGVAISLLVLGIVPCISVAQQPSKVWRVGILETMSMAPNAANLNAFLMGMRELGYVEGQNLILDYRSADGRADRFPNLATEMVRGKVDLILTRGTPATKAARAATAQIPIVTAASSDMVATGLAKSFRRPEGNVTGLDPLTVDLLSKRVELVREVFPKATRILAVMNMANAAIAQSWEGTERTARALNFHITLFDVRRGEDFERAFNEGVKLRANALLIGQDGLLQANRKHVVELATKYRLPAIYPASEYVDDGGLIGHGVSYSDLYRRAATYVDKILKGAKAGDLPIEQATKFDLVINLKTAKALGIAIPQSVLLRADRVIE
jgi:putative tryptophan/tyrosine transport system substrate-binding protein